MWRQFHTAMCKGHRPVRLTVFIAIACCLSDVPASAQEEANRRNILKTPGLVLETGAPTAVTWAMTFSGDGKRLLAAGDDHVVRDWPVTDKGLDTDQVATLRWQSWREWRGTIYAMAISPDPEAKLVAIAGWGAIDSNVVILDRKTTKVKFAVNLSEEMWKAGINLDFGGTTHALAFSPTGDELAIGKNDGTVWVWKFAQKGGQGLRKLGSHGPRAVGKKALYNFVSFVAYLGGDELLSGAQDGLVLHWPLGGKGKPAIAAKLNVPNPDVFAFHAPTRQVAAAGFGGANENRVEFVSVDGPVRDPIVLAKGALARALAFSADGKLCALGVENPPPVQQPWLPIVSEVHVYDVAKKTSVKIATLPASYNVTSVAFHPTRPLLAAAGGNHFEITVWDLKEKQPAQQVRGPGTAIWGVAFSKDNQALGFRVKRKAQPASHNDWADGAWSVFGLKKRNWIAPDQFQPVLPVEQVRGWRVEAAAKRAWRVVSPKGQIFPLPLIHEQDGEATCYTFVEPPGGGLQLAVGHRWGLSVFAVSDAGVSRIRLCHGHAGEVTSVAPSANHRLLVSAARDQTISCWSLDAWALQRELGASFEEVGGQLTVKDVKDGSPAWEADLSKGDQILALKANAKAVARPQWAATLANPIPGIELFFDFRRPGVDKARRALTTLRQRPIWRFFPMDNREWVLWRWRDYFYDSSANGDSFIGWQVNAAVNETPEFFKAEQFRKTRRFPDKVDEAIQGAFFRPERVMIADLLPPRIDFRQDPNDPLTFHIDVSDRGLGNSAAPRMVSIWINDYKYDSWAGRVPFKQTVVVPRTLLRHGQGVKSAAELQNHIFVQAKNTNGNRGESLRAAVPSPGLPNRPKLHGLFVGIGDYSKAARGPRGEEIWPDLTFPPLDAEEMCDAWKLQLKSGLYEPGRFVLLKDLQATRERIVQELEQMKKETANRPDDRVIFFFAGHGWAEATSAKFDRFNADRFALVCPRFSIKEFKETGVTSELLYDYLVGMPARKVVFLDACHSGSVKGAEYLRALTPDGVGPPIFTATERDQSAIEHEIFGHGIFTKGILDALGPHFKVVDANADGEVHAVELARYLAKRIPELMDEIRDRLSPEDRQLQQNIQFHPRLERAPAELLQPLARGPKQK